MHPAASIIFFTVSAGAGYGLLAALAVEAVLARVATPVLIASLLVGLALVTAGLLSSTFHLGQKQRAWRAFSQWRSSWLSREGVLAVLTYPVAIGFGAAALWSDDPVLIRGLGAALAAVAVATVVATAMIYASLKPVHPWASPLVPASYLAIGALTGIAWLNVIARFAEAGRPAWLIALVVIAGLAWWLKRRYWRYGDSTPGPATAESATGLGAIGKVSVLEPPHTGTNFLLDEMGFRIARKHARRLRTVAQFFGFAAPMALTAGALAVSGAAGTVLLVAALLSAGLGALTERWLFFAEARHTVMLYYGDRAP